MLGRLTAVGAVCLTAAVGFSGIATGDSDGAKAPLQPIQSLSTPPVPVPDTPPIQTPDVAGVNVPDVPAVQTPDVPAVNVPPAGAPTPPPPSHPSSPAPSSSSPSSSPSQPAASHTSSGSSKTPEHAQHSSSGSAPRHAPTAPAGGKHVDNSGKPDRIADQLSHRAHNAATGRARTKQLGDMPRLRPTDALNDTSGRLIRVDAVTASSGRSAALQKGRRGTTAAAIGRTSGGWTAPVLPLLFLGGLGLVAFTVMGNRVYAPAPANRSAGGASDRSDPQTCLRGDTKAVDSSLGSTASDVSPGDKVVAPGPPAAPAAAVTAAAQPSAASAHDGAQRAADGDSSLAETETASQPEAFTYTVRRRSGGLVGAARKGLKSLRTRR